MTTEPTRIDLTGDKQPVAADPASSKRKAETEEPEPSTTPTKKSKTNETITAKEKRELARIEREKKKEEERQEKLERKRKQDEERELKRKQAEKEKELKKKKQEEEKLEKEKKKEEERLERERKKEAERLQKEKEKQEKERIRLEKKKKLEEEKKAKEFEKKRIEEEKRKAEEAKERSQMRISSFFQVGQRPKTKKEQASDASSGSDSKVVTKSAYEKEFLPFFVQKNVTLVDTKKDISESKNELDKLIREKDSPQKSSFTDFLDSLAKPATTTTTITPEEIINALNSSTTTEQQVYQMIASLPPIKHISFYENSKPPYVGTWCSLAHQKIQSEIIQNPLNTELTGLDYGYDSDLEWNKEDDEGEDIGNDDDDEEEDEESSALEDDDDVEFVENDSQNGNKKKKFITLTVVNKWNDAENSSVFESFATVKLVDIADPIDPFHNYWGNPQASQAQTAASDATSIPSTESSTTTSTSMAGTTSNPNILIAQKKTIKDAEVLANLIKFIEKNDEFTIGTLVELSKKEFKDFTKALIKNTIQEIAIYNKKLAKWEIKQEMKDKYLVSV